MSPLYSLTSKFKSLPLETLNSASTPALSSTPEPSPPILLPSTPSQPLVSTRSNNSTTTALHLLDWRRLHLWEDQKLEGEALFQTHENLEHLAMMERVLGPLPQHMMSRADRRAEKYFRCGVRLDWPEGATSRESMRAVWKLPRLQNLVMQHVDHSAGDLIDLLQGLLRYEPSERLKARDALRHPFFMRDARRSNYPV